MVKIVLIYLLIVNVFSFALFGIDKRRAEKKKYRISEKALLLSAAIGGSAGALLGMKFYHHKTMHKKFRVVIPVLLVVQLAFDIWLIFEFEG